MPRIAEKRDRFEISDDKARLDVDRIHENLAQSYWAQGISRELVARSIEHSMCFGLYDGDAQIGFARVISDCSTFAYLSDVYVEPEYRKQGLGGWLIATVCAHPDLAGLRRFLLATRDAHDFYKPHGFRVLSAPERFLEIARPDPHGEEPAGPAELRSETAEVRFLEATLSPPSIAYTAKSSFTAERAHPADVPFEPSEMPSWPMGKVIQGPTSTRFVDATQRVVRVRPLGPGEGPLLRELRVGALRESPHTFGEQLEDALNRPEHEWVEQARALTDPNGPRVFIAEVDEWPAGLVLAVEDPFDAEICRVGGMWVEPAKRRRRAGVCMLEAVRAWARERDKRRLRLWVHADSPSARALYETFGFKYTGARKRFPREPDRELLEMDLRVE
jgi:GNAT superfamily N-acetyltransferase